MKILVAGGAGFIGSNFIHLLIKETSHQVVNLDALTYAGNLENLREVQAHSRYRFVKGDVRDQALVEKILHSGIEAVVNFAAESHVDRSIMDPGSFLQSNCIGCAALLEACRKIPVKIFLQVSTDEVYGPVPAGLSQEDHPMRPSSPYSASKAAAEMLCQAYHATFKMPVIVTRFSNNYGPFQFPEKLVPFFITNALEDKPLPLYGDGLNVRDWIYVADACQALLLVLEEGKLGQVYNVGGGNQRTNLEVTEIILKELKKPRRLIKFVADRPGHDRRYALDSTKIKRELGFSPAMDFEQGLASTIRWYRDHRDWWHRVKSGLYQEYYEKQYQELSKPETKAKKAKGGRKK